MQRRSFLRVTSGASAIAVAGCLSSIGGQGSDQDTVLDPPDREVDVDPADLAYPAYGQELPDVTLPSPLHDRDVSTREYVGSRETLLTFVFTRCPGPCPALTATLAQTQSWALEEGYDDEVVCMPITFDPEADTPARIEEFSELNGADPTTESWQFLRPQTPERAKEVIADREGFGVGFEEVPIDESDHGNHGAHDDESADDDEETNTHGETLPPEEPPETTFVHSNLLLLVNRDGFVERAYSPDPPLPDLVIGDLEAVRAGYE